MFTSDGFRDNTRSVETPRSQPTRRSPNTGPLKITDGDERNNIETNPFLWNIAVRFLAVCDECTYV